METNGFFQFEIIINGLVIFFLIHLNTYVMGPRPLEILYSFSAGINRRQILTSKVDPRAVGIKV